MTTNGTSLIRVRRSDAGLIRVTGRDAAGLCLVAEQYAAPYDLLGIALGVQPPRFRQVAARWRAAGYARTQVLAPGPAWCWLTAAGIAACGYPWQAAPARAGPPRAPARGARHPHVADINPRMAPRAGAMAA
jgi:hypothetical protein